MKCTVIKDFKYTGKQYKVGDVADFPEDIVAFYDMALNPVVEGSAIPAMPQVPESKPDNSDSAQKNASDLDKPHVPDTPGMAAAGQGETINSESK